MIPEIVVGMLLIIGYGLYIKSPKVDENDHIENCHSLFVDVLWFFIFLVVIECML